MVIIEHVSPPVHQVPFRAFVNLLPRKTHEVLQENQLHVVSDIARKAQNQGFDALKKSLEFKVGLELCDSYFDLFHEF